MTIGYLLDVFWNEAIVLLGNFTFSVILACVTLICMGWVTYKNNYDYNRAWTYTILSFVGAVGLNILWYLSAKEKLFLHESMVIVAATMLLVASIIIAYWIAAIAIQIIGKDKRELALNSYADWLQERSDSVRNIANKRTETKKESNMFTQAAKELRNIPLQSKTFNDKKRRKRNIEIT